MTYFDHPSFFWLFLLIGVILFCAVVGKIRHTKELSSWIAPRLSKKLHQDMGTTNYTWQLGLLSLVMAALIIALAKPILNEKIVEISIEQQDVCLIIDTSKSMEVRDVTVPRIEQAKIIAHDIISHLPYSRVSLIAFAGDAFTLAPFTQDHEALKDIISQMDTDIIGSQGSSTEQLFANLKKLQKHYQNEPLIILISDGEWHDDSPLKKMMSELPINSKWLTIGIGTTEGDLIPSATDPSGYLKDDNNYTILSRLNSEQLRSLAKLSAGSYLENPSTAALISTLESNLAKTQTMQQGSEQVSIKSDAVFAYLVTALVLLLIYMLKPLLTNKSPLSLGVLFALLVSIPTQEAQAVLFSQSPSHVLHQAATAYYKQDFKTAYKRYSKALTYDEPAVQADAYQGLSSTLYQQGWQQLDPQIKIKDTQGVSLETLVQKIQTIMQTGQIKSEQIESTRQLWEEALGQLTQVPETIKAPNQAVIEALLEALKQEEQEQEQQQNQDQQEDSENQDQQDQQEGDNQQNQDSENSEDSSQENNPSENSDDMQEDQGDSEDSNEGQDQQQDSSDTEDYQEANQQEASQEQREQAEKLLEQYADLQTEAPKNSELKKIKSRNKGKNY